MNADPFGFSEAALLAVTVLVLSVAAYAGGCLFCSVLAACAEGCFADREYTRQQRLA